MDGGGEGAVLGHVFAQCVRDSKSGEAFWEKSPLVRDMEAEYLIAQVAMHHLATKQAFLEHPELKCKRGRTTKGEQLLEADEQHMEVDQSCETLHAPIVARASPRELHLSCTKTLGCYKPGWHIGECGCG